MDSGDAARFTPQGSRVPNGEQQVDDPESQQISDLGLDSQVLSPAEGKQESSETTDLLVLVQYRLQKVISLYQECDLHFFGNAVCIGVNFAGHIGALVGRSESLCMPVVSLERDSSPSNEITETVRAR